MILIIVAAILLLDQAAKFLISKYLSLGQSLPVIKGVLRLTLVHNRGAAFGLFKGGGVFFILVAVVVAALVYSNLKKQGWHKISLNSVALSLILAGALGNLIDRARFGYVIDFLDFIIWPVFNVADSVVTVGAILLTYSMLVSNKNNKTVE